MKTPAVVSVYAPRHVTVLPNVERDAWTLKPYWIATESGPVDADLVQRGIDQAIDALGDATGYGAGFVIVHRGRVADWVILWWWTDEDILRRRIWQLGPTAALDVGDQHFVACVWELSIVDWERKAWINHVLRHPRRTRSPHTYLDARYPSEFC